MSDHTTEQLMEKFNKLPQDIKDAILNVNTSEIINSICGKYKLNVTKAGEVADETGLVMLGITHPKDFISNIAKRLEVDNMTASKIGQDVNEQIFSKVRESLKNLHNLQDETQTLSVSSGVTSTPGVNSVSGGIPIETKEEIKSTLEKDETVHTPEVPSIIMGVKTPSVFEEKTNSGVFRTPPEETKHTEVKAVDPYREPIE